MFIEYLIAGLSIGAGVGAAMLVVSTAIVAICVAINAIGNTTSWFD